MIADEPLTAVWRTHDRLHTDDATVALLVELAAADPTIAQVISDIEADVAGNGSVWAKGTARDGTPALLKLGARIDERQWMTALAATTSDIVPQIFGSGEMRGVGWLVLEFCPGKLDRSSSADVLSVVDAVARWQQAAAEIAADTSVMDVRWIQNNLEKARVAACPGDVGRAMAATGKAWKFVTAQCELTPNQGDVQFVNVVKRTASGPPLLIDPMPINTVWPYDAAYLEAVEGHLGLVHELGRARQALGLSTADDLERVEMFVRGFVASYWWRIAPWRHERAEWRDYVESCIDGLRW